MAPSVTRRNDTDAGLEPADDRMSCNVRHATRSPVQQPASPFYDEAALARGIGIRFKG